MQSNLFKSLNPCLGFGAFKYVCIHEFRTFVTMCDEVDLFQMQGNKIKQIRQWNGVKNERNVALINQKNKIKNDKSLLFLRRKYVKNIIDLIRMYYNLSPVRPFLYGNNYLISCRIQDLETVRSRVQGPKIINLFMMF